jgi:effector-binding domain-containing protein
MDHSVDVVTVPARPTAVVAAATTWQEFPLLWKGMLDEVWACVSAAGANRGCRNVMLYLDDVPHVEVGVELLEAFGFAGRVRASALPGGQVAMTVHRGPYGGLGAAHSAVVHWCAGQGLQLAGPRWEIYGHHRDNPAELETEVYHLLGG